MARTVLIVLKRRASGQTSTGEPVDTWAEYARVLGRVRTQRYGEFFADNNTEAERSIDFSIHYRSDIKPGDRADISGEEFEIVGHPENIRMSNRELRLRVRRVD